VVFSGTFLLLHCITLLFLWTSFIMPSGFYSKDSKFLGPTVHPSIGITFCGRLNSVNLIFWHWRNVNITFFPACNKATLHEEVCEEEGVSARIPELGITWSWVALNSETLATLPTAKSPGNPKRKVPFWDLQPVWTLCRRDKFRSLNGTSIPLSSSLWRNH